MENIYNELTAFIRKEFRDAETVGVDDSLLKGIIDSLGVFTLVGYIETHFGVTLDDTDLTTENLSTIRALGSLVHAKKIGNG